MLKEIFSKLKERFTKWMARREVIKRYNKLMSIEPKPFSVNRANIVLTNISLGNINNIINLVNLAKDACTPENYSELNKVIDQFFLTNGEIHYRDYFLDNNGTSNILINPSYSWNEIVKGCLDIELNILRLNNELIENPDNYYYLAQLKRVSRIVNNLITTIQVVESKC